MDVKRAWEMETEMALRAAGWKPDRCERELVQRWRTKLEYPGGFQMFPAAERILEEFGGLQASKDGPGRTCARGSFEINAELGWGEEDRFGAFSDFVDGRLFPIGEIDHGHAFLGVDESGVVYLIGDWLSRLGSDIYEALDAILLGKKSVLVAEEGNW